MGPKQDSQTWLGVRAYSRPHSRQRRAWAKDIFLLRLPAWLPFRQALLSSGASVEQTSPPRRAVAGLGEGLQLPAPAYRQAGAADRGIVMRRGACPEPACPELCRRGEALCPLIVA